MRPWLPGLAIVAAVVLSGVPPASTEPDEDRIEEFKRATAAFDAELQRDLSSPRFDAIRAPDRVESIPVQRRVRPDGSSTSADDVLLSAEAQPVPPRVAAELSKLILAVESYFPGYKYCLFNPGIVYRFLRAKAAVDVWVCFECNDLQFAPAGPGLTVRKLSFDPMRHELARLVRASRAADVRFNTLRPHDDSTDVDELLNKARAGRPKP